MDVVAREVEHLRGTVELTSQPGNGTQLTLRLPGRLALESALIVRVGGQPLAIPASHVEHAQQFEPCVSSLDTSHDVASANAAPSARADRSVTYGDRSIPVVFARDAGNWPAFLGSVA